MRTGTTRGGRPGSMPRGAGQRRGAGPARKEVQLSEDPRFQTLVRERSTFGWTLTAIMVAVYLAFIFLVAFAHDLMATKVVGDVSLGILLGLAVIVLAFVLTGIYVSRANSRFDALTRDLVARSRR